MINYCVQGIELFQKLYIGLEYMFPKDIANHPKLIKLPGNFASSVEKQKQYPL